MKKFVALALGLVLMGALGTNVAAAVIPVNALPGFSAALPDPFLLTFDENGHATIAINGGATNPLTGTLQADLLPKVCGLVNEAAKKGCSLDHEDRADRARFNFCNRRPASSSVASVFEKQKRTCWRPRLGSL